MNEILFATYPEIRLCLERCPLVKGDHEFLGLYNKTLSIKRSFVASVEFLRNVRSKVTTYFVLTRTIILKQTKNEEREPPLC